MADFWIWPPKANFATEPFEAQAAEERKQVRERRMASQATTLRTDVHQDDEGRIVATVQAMRSVWVGSVAVREEPMQAVLTLAPWPAAAHRGGVIVLGFQVDPPLLD
jgi:hypothetical protein